MPSLPCLPGPRAMLLAAALVLVLPATADAALVFPDGDIMREGLGDSGTTVQWRAPTATGGSLQGTNCDPDSGSAFPTGTTEVECVGSVKVCPTTPQIGVCFIQLTGGTFTVTVTRGFGPALTGLSDVSATADEGRAAATVSYPLPIASDPSGVAGGSVGCAPASGSDFAVGETTVTCRARDTIGNESTAAFRVNVAPAPAAPAAPGGPAAEAPASPADPGGFTPPAADAPRAARPVALGSRLRISRGVARVTVSCPADNPASCQGSLKLETARAVAVKAGGRKRRLRFGRAGFALAPGAQATVRLRLGRTARAALGGRGRLRLKAVATTADQAGKPLTGARTFTVKRTTR